MMADPSKDLRDAASPARVLLSQSPQLAELQVRSTELSRRQHELRRWHDGLDRPRVLLVDDIDDNLCALEAILRPLGLILVSASSGEEAMKAPLRNDFALNLLDVVMPGLDGFATAARIKRLDQTRIAAEPADQVCELWAAADALTRAHQVGDDLSVGVLPPDVCVG